MDPTAAPVDLTINGVTYLAYPLRDVDHETMNKWVRGEYIRRLEEAGVDKQLIATAMINAVTMEWLGGDGLRVAMTVAGVHRLARLLIRDKTEIPFDDMARADSLNAVYEAYRALHAVAEEEATGSGGTSSPK